MFDSAARYEVGSWDHNGFVADPGLLHADICHVRLWSTVRTETEIQQHMTVLLDGDETGLIEDWRFGNALTSNASGGTTLTAVGSPSFITDVPF
jgi:hypothetical protein